jgi:hypothetical protein
MSSADSQLASDSLVVIPAVPSTYWESQATTDFFNSFVPNIYRPSTKCKCHLCSMALSALSYSVLYWQVKTRPVADRQGNTFSCCHRGSGGSRVFTAHGHNADGVRFSGSATLLTGSSGVRPGRAGCHHLSRDSLCKSALWGPRGP